MVQGGGDLDFAQEPLGAQNGAQRGMQHLDGNGPVMLRVVRQIYSGRRSATELAGQLVGAEEGPGCQWLVFGLPIHQPGGRMVRSGLRGCDPNGR